MDHKEVTMTLDERENLMIDRIPHNSGFTPQPLQRLIRRRRPCSIIDIECRHFLRTSTQDFTNEQPTVEHRLWIEAGKTAAPFPVHENKNYNSNVWRNFCRQFGLNVPADGRTTKEAIAALYPLNIPPPSHIGDYTFDKYIRETNLFRNEKSKHFAIRRAATEIHEFTKLKCRTDARNPPINEKGDILPPENYRKYAHRFIPCPSPQPSPPPPGQKTDIFGRLYTPRSRPHLWKLSYKLNHPKFKKLQEEVEAKQEMIAMLRKRTTHHNFPQVLPSPLTSPVPSDV